MTRSSRFFKRFQRTKSVELQVKKTSRFFTRTSLSDKTLYYRLFHSLNASLFCQIKTQSWPLWPGGKEKLWFLCRQHTAVNESSAHWHFFIKYCASIFKVKSHWLYFTQSLFGGSCCSFSVTAIKRSVEMCWWNNVKMPTRHACTSLDWGVLFSHNIGKDKL